MLEPRVLVVLVELLSRPGELLIRGERLDTVWGHRIVATAMAARRRAARAG